MDVTVEEQAQIINCYLVKFQRQDDVAVRYQVKPDLVSRLVRQHRADPFFLSKKLQRQHMESTMSEAIEHEVGEMLKICQPIESATQVQNKVKINYGKEPSLQLVSSTMKN